MACQPAGELLHGRDRQPASGILYMRYGELISVVIPAYDREQTIAAAVEGVLAQSYAAIEVIVVDDGSRDDTVRIVEGMTDPRLRLLRHETNRGAAAARNTGIAAARGEWVAFQDSDDLWMPDKLDKQVARLATSPAGTVAVYCGMNIEHIHNPSAPLRYLPGPEISPREGDILVALLRSSFVSTQTLMVRRDALLRIGGFDAALPALEDWECMLRLAPLGPVAFVDETLVHQRFSDNSLTRSWEKRLAAQQRVLDKHAALFAAHPEILAGHLVTVAGALRRFGRHEEAAARIHRALRLVPLRPWLWGIAAWLAVLQLRTRLVSGRG